MILKIDSTNKEAITVELVDKTSKPTRLKQPRRLTESQKPGSQVLLPMIVKILKKKKLNFSDLSAIEVNTGPGSFTGTRVGVAIANALGYSLNLPVNGKRGKIALPIYEKSKFD